MIPCNNENINVFEKNPLILFSQREEDQRRRDGQWEIIVKIQEEEMDHEKNHVLILWSKLGLHWEQIAFEPWSMSVPMVSSKNQGTMPKGSNINHP
jgi:hypothetical protein